MRFIQSWLERLTIRQRLAVLISSSVMVVSCVLTTAWHSLDREVSITDEMVRLHKLQSIQQHADMMHDAIRSDVYRLILHKDDEEGVEEARLSLERNSGRLSADLDLLFIINTSINLKETLEETKESSEKYIYFAKKIASKYASEAPEARKLIEEFEKEFYILLDKLENQTKIIEKEQNISNNYLNVARSSTWNNMIYATLISVIFVIIIGLIVGRSLRETLRVIELTTKKIACGDINARCNVHHTDEIGSLSQSINQLAHNLSDTIAQMAVSARRDAFASQLSEALEMSHDETAAYRTVERAMHAISQNNPMELLLADSSEANLERAAENRLTGAPGCKVTMPFDCVAVCRGAVVRFDDSDALNACPKLHDRNADQLSAVCAPILFMGRAIGVLHATGTTAEPLSDTQTAQLAILGGQIGARIGTIRAFQKSQVQARTDSLTGLLNRRSIEAQLRPLLKSGRRFSFVLADLDRFKQLNVTFGHQAGDAALRLFSETVASCAREADLLSRWGGEEFVFILIDADAAKACDWANRVRERLSERVQGANMPSFTASFGIADSAMANTAEELQKIADAALYKSKDAGRDRATIGDAEVLDQSQPRHTYEHPKSLDLRMLAAE